MMTLLQRVKTASVVVNKAQVAHIEQGLLVLVGIEKTDSLQLIKTMAQKILKYRVFADKQDKMNLSVIDIKGQVLLVPQFTLVADTQKGLRPSFSHVAKPEQASSLFNQLVDIMQYEAQQLNSDLKADWLQQGLFGADMLVSLVNDGPVTFSLHL